MQVVLSGGLVEVADDLGFAEVHAVVRLEVFEFFDDGGLGEQDGFDGVRIR